MLTVLSTQVSSVEGVQQIPACFCVCQRVVEGTLFDQNADLSVLATVSAPQVLSIQAVYPKPACFCADQPVVESVAFYQNADFSALTTVLAMQVLSIEAIQQIPAPTSINQLLKVCFLIKTLSFLCWQLFRRHRYCLFRQFSKNLLVSASINHLLEVLFSIR